MLPHRYQPEQPNTVYQMARTSDELDPVDQNELVSSSDSQTGFLPEAERLSLKTNRLLCPWNFPSKNTGVGGHFLLQAIFPTQGLNPHPLHWQADSLPLCEIYHIIRADVWNGNGTQRFKGKSLTSTKYQG